MTSSRSIVDPSAAESPFYAGVDLGGTGIKVGLVDNAGRTLAYRKIPTDVPSGPEEGARRMGETVAALAAEIHVDLDAIAHVGLASPGTMDVPRGMLLEPHNLPGWYNFPIRDRVAHHCDRPVAYTNDANAAAYGEFWVGTGSEFHSMVLFTLGTGIGCGVIIGDLLIDGENSHGAECGHIVIDLADDARLCGCGKTGHLEAYASATAVIKRTEEALAADATGELADRVASGAEISPLLLAEAADEGDALALELILETARYLGVGAVNLMHTIDPDGVVFGGAMTFGGHASPLGRQFLDRIRQEIQLRAFPVLAQTTKIDYASLGGDAGYLGAAGIARRAHQNSAESSGKSS